MEGKILLRSEQRGARMSGIDHILETEEVCKEIITCVPMPLVITGTGGDILFYNREFVDQFGYTLEDIQSADEWGRRVYPDDDYRKRVRQAWEEAISAAAKEGGPIDTQVWDLTTKEGITRRVEFRMMPLEEVSVITMHDITDLEKAREDIQQKANLLNMLLEVSKDFAATMDLDRLFQATTDGIVEMTGLDSSAVYLVEDDLLILQASSPALPPDFPAELRKTPLEGHPHIAATLSAGEVMVIEDISRADLTFEEKDVARRRGLRSVYFFPIQFRSKTAGTLIVGSIDQPRLISDQERDLCETLVNQAALAIENAENYHKIQEDARDLEKLVKKRTERLNTMVNAMAGREVRMAELKKVVRTLRGQLVEAGIEPAVPDPLRELGGGQERDS